MYLTDSQKFGKMSISSSNGFRGASAAQLFAPAEYHGSQVSLVHSMKMYCDL
jgi:hypothetical protein